MLSCWKFIFPSSRRTDKCLTLCFRDQVISISAPFLLSPVIFIYTNSMGRSQETFSKKEKEKKKIQKRKEKEEKREERKANSVKGQGIEAMIAYVDENGNLTDTPPDTTKRTVIRQEDIVLGVPRNRNTQEEPVDNTRTGIITFFNNSKGFGFIRDLDSKESVFLHINNINEPVAEQDKVTFETEKGPRGLSAVNVKKVV